MIQAPELEHVILPPDFHAAKSEDLEENLRLNCSNASDGKKCIKCIKRVRRCRTKEGETFPERHPGLGLEEECGSRLLGGRLDHGKKTHPNEHF